MMKRLLSVAAIVLTATGCTSIRDLRKSNNPYEEPPFYAKYLNTGSTLDASIAGTLDELRQNPASAELHNRLGALLIEKRFPADAEREFERAVNADRRFYPAWYNLGLVRAARGDELGARRALVRTIQLRPGHAPALFQLGLIEEERQHVDRAVELYAKAFTINPALLQVQVNPRILDTRLTHLALLKMYPNEHSRRSMQFQGTPPSPRDLAAPTPTAPSPQAAPETIVAPAPPVTDPAMQPAPATPPATTQTPAKRRNPARRPTPPPPPEPQAPPVVPPGR